jgi:acyl transferase domain-containing protein
VDSQPNGEESAHDGEPIAIIGMGCRFPGANSPSEYWNVLCSGRSMMRDVPSDRWNADRFYDPDPDRPGTTYVRKGGFLQGAVDEFDAAFFGISPRDAMYMDPQQRLLLEVAWETFEDAGVVPQEPAKRDTGVFIGGFTLDSLILQASPANLARTGIRSPTGTSMTMLANRLSYCFDFSGPSVSVDTACSASLVALHLACRALTHGECSLALAGGVNVMLVPQYWVVMSKGRFLAKDGYCKSFDEAADGYARGEGAGLVLLKPLHAALRDGNEIYAVVRGTGVNHDGRTGGISEPNPHAQEALIRQVYARAGVPMNSVRYVEAHGTGTAVGDPAEASVLGRTFGAGRSASDRCVVGSAKAAIGHLEAAAGVAGVIKAALCLHHHEIPPQAKLQTPNPSIPFDALGLRLARERELMPRDDAPTYVGVNSFGYGGTNAHAILQSAPP